MDYDYKGINTTWYDTVYVHALERWHKPAYLPHGTANKNIKNTEEKLKTNTDMLRRNGPDKK